MKRLGTALVCVLVLAASTGAAQQPPPVAAIVQQLKGAVEPSKPSLRTMTMTLSDLGESVQFTGLQARKKLPTGNWMVIVMTQPVDIRGTALLLQEPIDPTQPDAVAEDSRQPGVEAPHGRPEVASRPRRS